MTLLSIREQEAVKGTRKAYEFAVMELFKRTFGNKYVGGEHFADKDKARDAHEQALILATRDAIARQVREEANASELNGRDELATGFSIAATFIEGLDV